MSDAIVQVEGVGKKFSKSLKRSMLYGGIDMLKSSMGFQTDSKRLRKGEFWAVNDLSFTLKKGEALGVIGANGSGKSTLLKMLNGIYLPDKGTIRIKGRVGALIQVGAGFHPLLSGRENIYINGAILGMSKQEIDKKFDSIVEFADIGEFLDSPVNYYSSGMFVRLGFAVAIHCEPDILLIDEVLAVGDFNFQSKCMQKMGELIEKGTSIIFVSHNMSVVQMICQKALLLHHGKLICHAAVGDAVNEYYKIASSSASSFEKGRLEKTPHENRVELKEICLCDAHSRSQRSFRTGEPIFFKCKFVAKQAIRNPIFHISLDGDTYHGYNTRDDGIETGVLEGEFEVVLKVSFMGLASGLYRVCVAVWDSHYIVPYFWDWNVKELEVCSHTPPLGRFIFDHNWSLSS